MIDKTYIRLQYKKIYNSNNDLPNKLWITSDEIDEFLIKSYIEKDIGVVKNISRNYEYVIFNNCKYKLTKVEIFFDFD